MHWNEDDICELIGYYRILAIESEKQTNILERIAFALEKLTKEEKWKNV